MRVTVPETVTAGLVVTVFGARDCSRKSYQVLQAYLDEKKEEPPPRLNCWSEAVVETATAASRS